LSLPLIFAADYFRRQRHYATIATLFRFSPSPSTPSFTI
jgi:hypothetical protein